MCHHPDKSFAYCSSTPYFTCTPTAPSTSYSCNRIGCAGRPYNNLTDAYAEPTYPPLLALTSVSDFAPCFWLQRPRQSKSQPWNRPWSMRLWTTPICSIKKKSSTLLSKCQNTDSMPSHLPRKPFCHGGTRKGKKEAPLPWFAHGWSTTKSVSLQNHFTTVEIDIDIVTPLGAKLHLADHHQAYRSIPYPCFSSYTHSSPTLDITPKSSSASPITILPPAPSPSAGMTFSSSFTGSWSLLAYDAPSWTTS